VVTADPMKKNRRTASPDHGRYAKPFTIALIGACLLMTGFSGCAFMNRENTLLLNQVEAHLWPEDTALRVAVFPLVFPAGLAAVLIDAFVVHPALVIENAAKDTGDVLWDNWEWEDHYVTECAALPWRAVLTPLVFTSDFLVRAFFDIPPRSALEELDEGEAKKQVDKWLNGVRVHFDQGRYVVTLEAIKTIYRKLPELEGVLAWQDQLDIMVELTALSLQAAYQSGRYDLMPIRSWPESLEAHEDLKAVEQRMEDMQASDDSLARLTAYLYEMQSRRSDDELIESARSALSDPDMLVRYAVLAWVDTHFDDADKLLLEPLMKNMAETDPEPVIRAYAGQIVDR
jgi:hypothetical protein